MVSFVICDHYYFITSDVRMMLVQVI